MNVVSLVEQSAPGSAARPWLTDTIIAAALGLAALAGTAAAGSWAFDGQRRPDEVALALVAGAAVALSARRRWPGTVLLVVAVLVSGYSVLRYPYGPILLLLLVAAYTVARHQPPRRSLMLAGAAVAIVLVHVVTGWSGVADLYDIIPGSAWVVVPCALGLTRRLATESAARQQAESIRRQVDQERLRIAQEVHDIVGHGLVAMKMQADIALHLIAKKPEQAQAALAAISRSSSVALEELRATLAVVRAEAGLDERAPMPSLSRLHELLDRARQAGIDVTVRVDGQPRDLPAVLDVTGYRILQESLTNVLRHGQGRQADVLIDYTGDGLRLSIGNPISQPVTRRIGNGITGMGQRVQALGGLFSAGPVGHDRFEVTATLPWRGEPA